MKSDNLRPRESRKGQLAPGKIIAGLILAINIVFLAAPAAQAETRTLKIYFLHTKERAEIAYKRNGRYIPSGLKQINHMLRDWRRNEPTEMDPRLLDLLWEVYRAVGSREYIHVVSGYRSPATNAMLRSRSSGVAKKSQHMLGKAIDFYLPDVKLSRLRDAGLRLQAGGVGYYPRSGSPFIHLDVGGVRHWPRLSRKELVAVFPNGNTLHVPSDGKPLPGYEQAVAAYEARQRNGGSIQMASETGNRGRGLLAALFGGGADEEEDNAEIAVAQRPAQAVSAAPEPQPQERRAETPATILAALPARAVPVPRLAPRPDAEVGPTAPAEAAREAIPAPVEATEAPEVQTALNVPVPTQRPEYEPPEAQQLAAADSVDLPGPVAYAMPTRRPERSAQADVIAELLSTRKETPPVTQASLVSVPPSIQDLKEEMAQADASAKAQIVAAVKAKSSEVEIADVKEGATVSDSPRVALAAYGDNRPAGLIAAGTVNTTAKGSRPRPQDARVHRTPTVVPVAATPTQRVLSSHSVISSRPETQAPDFNIRLAEAPQAVYTAGFEQKHTPVTDMRRFTGKAVTFLSLAKFKAE